MSFVDRGNQFFNILDASAIEKIDVNNVLYTINVVLKSGYVLNLKHFSSEDSRNKYYDQLKKEILEYNK